MTEFTLTATVQTSYDATVDRVRELLAEAGFGVLTEIDLRATLRANLGVEVPAQVVLGACRPQLAHAALQADPRVATMLPCNVVVAAETSPDGADRTRVAVFDPAVMMSFSDAPELADVATEARTRLAAMLSSLANDPTGDLAGELENTDATRA